MLYYNIDEYGVVKINEEFKLYADEITTEMKQSVDRLRFVQVNRGGFPGRKVSAVARVTEHQGELHAIIDIKPKLKNWCDLYQLVHEVFNLKG